MKGALKIISCLNYPHFYQVRATFEYGLAFCWKWILRISMYQFVFFGCMQQEQILVNLSKNRNLLGRRENYSVIQRKGWRNMYQQRQMRQFQKSRQQELMGSFFQVQSLGWVKSDDFNLCVAHLNIQIP